MTPARVLHEDARVLVVDKPAGVPVIPGRPGPDGAPGEPSLREQLERARGQRLFVVHRLDRDTSGALAFALDAGAHRELSMAFEAGRVHKRYLALVEGRLEGEHLVDVALAPGRKGKMRPAAPGEEGKPSQTRVRVREAFELASLVEAEPLTGRTHQIRVHLRCLGHALLFDHQYGRDEPLREADLGGAGDAVLLARTPLHAARLEWPALGGLPGLGVEAPLPEDMARVLERLRTAAGART